jgi:hypothetical protein
MLVKQDGQKKNRSYNHYSHVYIYVSYSKEASKGKAIMYAKKIGHGCWLSTEQGGDGC